MWGRTFPTILRNAPLLGKSLTGELKSEENAGVRYPLCVQLEMRCPILRLHCGMSFKTEASDQHFGAMVPLSACNSRNSSPSSASCRPNYDFHGVVCKVAVDKFTVLYRLLLRTTVLLLWILWSFQPIGTLNVLQIYDRCTRWATTETCRHMFLLLLYPAVLALALSTANVDGIGRSLKLSFSPCFHTNPLEVNTKKLANMFSPFPVVPLHSEALRQRLVSMVQPRRRRRGGR